MRLHLDRALAPIVEFIDPSVESHGIDEFEANVHDVQARIPGAQHSRTSGVDSHHRLHRYTWEIVQNGELLLPGFDVTEVDGHGMVTRVLGSSARYPTATENFRPGWPECPTPRRRSPPREFAPVPRFPQPWTSRSSSRAMHAVPAAGRGLSTVGRDHELSGPAFPTTGIHSADFISHLVGGILAAASSANPGDLRMLRTVVRLRGVRQR